MGSITILRINSKSKKSKLGYLMYYCGPEDVEWKTRGSHFYYYGSKEFEKFRLESLFYSSRNKKVKSRPREGSKIVRIKQRFFHTSWG